MAATFEQLKLRLNELALKGVELQIQRGAFKQVALTCDSNAAFCLQCVICLIVFNPI